MYKATASIGSPVIVFFSSLKVKWSKAFKSGFHGETDTSLFICSLCYLFKTQLFIIAVLLSMSGNRLVAKMSISSFV